MKAVREELAQLRQSNLETEAAAARAPPPAAVGNEGFKAPALPSRAPNPTVELATVSALEAIDFRLVEGPEDVEKRGFAPAFAHQHFGDDEVVRGYPDLRISHFYSAGSLQLFTRITHGLKQPAAVPADVGAVLRVYMPDEDVETEDKWGAPSLDALLERVEEDKRTRWTPPGQQIARYEQGGRHYQVRHGNVGEPGMRAYHQRMRPFVIWFVDAANFIDDQDNRWDVFMLFREPAAHDGSYCFCGYATSYTFFSWAGSGSNQQQESKDQLERFASMQGPQVASAEVEKIVASFVSRSYEQLAATVSEASPWYQRRFRVSQFLILPPFQRSGHGVRLFETMCQWARSAYAPLRDVTVEDPSPSFVAMRDHCDLAYLVQKQLLLPGCVVNDRAAIERALREERRTCEPQVKRLMRLIRWMEAVSPEAKTSLRQEMKRLLYKDNSADMPEEQEAIRAALAELWVQEEASFNATLLRLRLIN